MSKTTKQIFDENKKRDDYWFNRKMEDFERVMNRNKNAVVVKEEVEATTQLSFSDAEIKFLMSL